MNPCANEFIGEYQGWFKRNRLTKNNILSIRQILEKKWECNIVIYKLFIGFQKAYEAVKEESSCDMLIKNLIHQRHRLRRLLR